MTRPFRMLVLVVLLLSRSSAAQERFTSIEVVPPREERPDAVCVWGKAPPKPGPIADCGYDDAFVNDAPPAVGVADSLRLYPKPADVQSDDENKEACARVVRPRAARLILRGETSRLICAVNTEGVSVRQDDARVLLLTLGKGPVASGAEPMIAGLSLHGNVVSLRIAGVSFGAHGISALIGVQGGDYAKGAAKASLADQERLVLPIVPLWVTRPLVLPPRSKSLSTLAADCSPSRCTISPDEQTITIAAVNETVPRSVSVSDGSQFIARASWMTPAPPDVVTPVLSEVSFHWQPDCLARVEKNSQCPRAALYNSAASCDPPTFNVAAGTCDYRCPTPSALSLPARVEFTLPRTDPADPRASGSFAAELKTAGQTLEGYLAAEDRQLVVQLERSARPEYAGMRVARVLLSGSHPQSIALSAGGGGPRYAIVPFPGLSCGQTVVYQYLGDLSYNEVVGRVQGPGTPPSPGCKDGVLCLESPRDKLDEFLTLALAPSGGVYYPAFNDANARAKWMAGLELVGRWNRTTSPMAQRWGVEARLGVSVSFTWSSGPNWEGNYRPSGEERSYPFMRFSLVLQHTWQATEFSYLSYGAGVCYGRPVLNEALAFTSPGACVIVPSVNAGYRISRRTALEAFFRASWRWRTIPTSTTPASVRRSGAT